MLFESTHGEVKCRSAYDGNGKIDGSDGMDDVWIIKCLDVPGREMVITYL